MSTTTTREQAIALTKLVHLLRPDWDERGIYEALKPLAGHNPFDMALRAIRAAGDPKVKTPGVIPLDGPHTRERIAATESAPRNPRPEEQCEFHVGEFKHSCGPCHAEAIAEEQVRKALARSREPVSRDPSHPVAAARGVYHQAVANLCPHRVQPIHCSECRDLARERALAQAEGRPPRPIQTVDLPETTPPEHGTAAETPAEPPVGPTTRPEGSEPATATTEPQQWVCDGCMQYVTARQVAVWADGEHVLCGTCLRRERPGHVPPMPENGPPEDAGLQPANEHQLTRLHILFGEVGLTDRDDKLAYCQATLALPEPPESTKALTFRQAHQLIRALTEITKMEAQP